MKTVFSILKCSHQKQRLLWMTGGYNHLLQLLPTKVTSTINLSSVPSLMHLVVRTLTTAKSRKTHYEILDLSPSATAKEIRHAFLKLSKQCHPDASKDPNNHKRFVQVNEAYSVLSKPSSRREYDASLTSAGTARSHGRGPHHHAEYGHNHNSFYSKGHRYYDHTRYHHHNNDADWAKNRADQHSENLFINFYTVTFCVTCATIGLIFHYMQNYFPDSRLRGLKNNLRSHEIEKHDFIMTSEHEGDKVYYYAVPKANDPESYEVLVVKRSQVKDSDIHELQELNNVEYNKQKKSLE